MSEPNEAPVAPGAPGAPDERGDAPATAPTTTTYELLQARLRRSAEELRTAADQVNGARAAAFASVGLALAEQDRVPTEAACIPRDALCVGDLLVIGHNIPPGLATNREVGDVFSLFRVSQRSERDWDFVPAGPGFLADPSFQRDFKEIYTYYADARLLQLARHGDELRMVFGIGSSDEDTRVLRWRIRPAGSTATLDYLDAYGEVDRSGARRYDFVWNDAGRDHIVEGRWPHVNLEDTLFIGLSHGQLEFRIDDAVSGGRTVGQEALAEREADLGELRIAYVRLGDLLLVRLLPYRENVERFYLYNRLTRALQRVDAMARGCHQLPEGHGVIFPGGYCLQNGEHRLFSTDATGFELTGARRSPNGEDLLYSYYRDRDGQYLLLHYNLVSRQMGVPLSCHGYALFDDGTIVCVREDAGAQRVHTISVYTSPFCAPEQYRSPVASDSFFGRVGNPALVAVLGECLSLATDAADAPFNNAVFEALVARTTKVLDGAAWLNEPDAGGLGPLLVGLRKAAGAVLDEFAAVTEAKRHAAVRAADLTRQVDDLQSSAALEGRDTDALLELLGRCRALLGELAALAEDHDVEAALVAAQQQRVQGCFDTLSAGAIGLLSKPDALDAVAATIEAARAAGAQADTAAAVLTAATPLQQAADRLVLLTEVVGGLDTDDVTVKTAVLARLAELLARRNAARADLDQRAAALRQSESSAGFAAAMAVLAQRSTAALMATVDVAGCDGALAVMTAELENIELRFGDVASFASAVAARRDELHEAFLRRRETLAAERAARVQRSIDSARRVLDTVVARAAALSERSEIDALFATDALVAKVRATMAELVAMGEAARAAELEVALSTARDTARRVATDRSELFDADTVRIGRVRFATNREPFELRLTGTADTFELRLTGTDLVLPLRGGPLDEYLDQAAQAYPSDLPGYPRALFLAFDALRNGVDPATHATTRLEDGYEAGVHDVDAAALLAAARAALDAPGLRYRGAVRAVAGMWLAQCPSAARPARERELAALAAIGPGRARRRFAARHIDELAAIAEDGGLEVDLELVLDALIAGPLAVSREGAEAAGRLRAWLPRIGLEQRNLGFGDLVRWAADLFDAPAERSDAAVTGSLGAAGAADPLGAVAGAELDRAAEAAWLVLDDAPRLAASAQAAVRVEGLRSVEGGVLHFDVGAAFCAYETYRRGGLDRFERFARVRRDELRRWRSELAVAELRPKVLSSFVRNRLVDEVLLPLVGENLSRQLGLQGAAQGLLLIVSPPGYGKTTLVEYVADLLGMALVKVSGPALGHQVTSLDPARAPDATSAAELTKLNRAFAMGTNVICYLDDIQHCSPELLSKFIPLGDATRRIEGVLDGMPRTFELSGKRFVMVMAGNPYTSSGAAFRIPDMLANRADVHNLGEVAGRHHDAFAQSYLENACGVNDVLAPVAARGRQDLDVLLQAVQRDTAPRSDQLQHRYGAAELQAVLRTLGHLARVRDTLLRVNAAYIASATLDDALRGEPAFLLQGSYRNMARIASRLLPAMSGDEVDELIAEHYRAEAQTLGAAADWNLAKLAEVVGNASDADRRRLDDLRRRWKEANVGHDPLQVMAAALRTMAAQYERTAAHWMQQQSG